MSVKVRSHFNIDIPTNMLQDLSSGASTTKRALQLVVVFKVSDTLEKVFVEELHIKPKGANRRSHPKDDELCMMCLKLNETSAEIRA